MSLRICYLPCDFDGSGSYRCFFPAREMSKRGHETLMPPYTIEKGEGMTKIEFNSAGTPDADVYVLQRRMEMEWAVLIPVLREMGKVVVAETDDWFLGVPTYNPAAYSASPYKRSFAVEHGARGPQIVAVKRERKNSSAHYMHQAFSEANFLTVSSNFLAEQYSRYNPNVHMLPNYLDWEMWENVTPQYEVERERVRIGWMGAMQWRKGDLNVLRGLIGPFMRRHPEVDFVSAGDDDERVHDYLEIPYDQRVTVGRARFKDLPLITATMDIGLVPLEMNNFNEAKSDLKGKEYAACGVPCIASPTESYRGWVEEGSNGFLAAKPRKWLAHLETLVSDDDLRRRMGRSAREKAKQHTIQAHSSSWESLYQSEIGPSQNAEELFACM